MSSRWKLNRWLRVTGPIRDGFWTRVLTVLNQGAWATAHGMRFFVHHNDSDDPYFDSALGGSAWEQYFEPIGGIPLDQVRRTIGEATVAEMGCAAAWLLYKRGEDVYPRNFTYAVGARALRAVQVAKWVRVRASVLRRVDAAWASQVLGTPGNTQRQDRLAVLGVHMRGTDKHLRPITPPAAYFPFIDAFIRSREAAGQTVRLVLATDDSSFASETTARYGGRVAQQASVLRAEGRNAIWRSRGGDAHRRGLEVIVDTLLLSRCDFLLKGASAVSEFALYFAPHLVNRSFDFSIRDNPRPHWMPRGSTPFAPVTKHK
jgi:hypothetical protein